MTSPTPNLGPGKRLLRFVFASKLSVLTRLACVCSGLSLVFMVLIVVVKIPLLLVLGVGVAHGFGILGILFFGAAVLKDSLSMRSRSSLLPPSRGPRPPDQSTT
jgi:hypothetical protein